MKKTYKVENVKCGGCASTLKSKLLDQFGEVEVNLDLMPREISLDIDDDKEQDLRVALKKLGYPMSDEKLGVFDTAGTKAMSFVSCAVGKVENGKN